jgi:hypothetical protein
MKTINLSVKWKFKLYLSIGNGYIYCLNALPQQQHARVSNFVTMNASSFHSIIHWYHAHSKEMYYYMIIWHCDIKCGREFPTK